MVLILMMNAERCGGIIDCVMDKFSSSIAWRKFLYL